MKKADTILTVEHKETSDDGWGDGAPDDWQPLLEEWFSLVPLSGREYERADQMESETTHKARCRYFEGANSGMRLRQGERIFNVVSVINWEERNKWLDWRLVEVPSG